MMQTNQLTQQTTFRAARDLPPASSPRSRRRRWYRRRSRENLSSEMDIGQGSRVEEQFQLSGQNPEQEWNREQEFGAEKGL